jgi:hypothetical protein
MRHYVLKLSNGSQIDTFSKPKLQGQSYYYKDALGRERVLPSSRVVEVEPASMAREEQKAFKPPQPPKKRHWYYLWLATSKTAGEDEPIPYA